MTVEIQRLHAADYEEAMDFINLVFSQNSVPHDFASLVPKICRPEEEFMRLNLAARRDGRIRGMVTTVPMTFHAGGRTLSLVGIGNVSTHLNERGGGLMRLLMTRAMDEIDRLDVDFSCLGGLRQRYANYGYEACGAAYRYLLTARNAKLALGDETPLTWQPLALTDGEALDAARRMYERRSMRIEREPGEEFYRFLTSWKARPYVARGRDGEVLAYLCAKPGTGGVSELDTAGDDPALYLRALASWVLQNDLAQAEVIVMPWERALQRVLGRVCEDFSVHRSAQYRIRNWDRVLDACLALRASYAPLPEGEAVVGVQGYGNLALRIENGRSYVEKTSRAAALTLPPLDAARFFFGPLPAGAVAAVDGPAAAFLEAWLPLPLGILGQDKV